jgi:hypothetical protein
VESDGSAGEVAHQTINFGSSLNTIEAAGKVDFLSVHTTFVHANPTYFAFILYGYVTGDAFLYSTPYGNRVVNFTSTAVASPGQTCLCNGTFSVTLPSISLGNVLSATLTIKNVGTGVITVTPPAGVTIDGASSVVLVQQYESLQFVVVSGEYYILSALYAPPAVTPQAGILLSNVNLVANTLTTIFTVTLPVGLFLVSYGATFGLVSQFSAPVITMAVGGATATFSGNYSAEGRIGTTTNNPTTTPHVTALVNVTVAGTILLQAQSNETDIVEQLTLTEAFGGATGWTAVKVG